MLFSAGAIAAVAKLIASGLLVADLGSVAAEQRSEDRTGGYQFCHGASLRCGWGVESTTVISMDMLRGNDAKDMTANDCAVSCGKDWNPQGAYKCRSFTKNWQGGDDSKVYALAAVSADGGNLCYLTWAGGLYDQNCRCYPQNS